MQTEKTPAGTGAGGGDAGVMPSLSPPPPEKSSEITWEDLRRVEYRALPVLMLAGVDDDRIGTPPQALTRALLNELFRELRELRDQLRRCA